MKKRRLPRSWHTHTHVMRHKLELKPDVPLQEKAKTLSLFEATGSIGEKTFSLLPQLVNLRIIRSRITHIEDGVFGSLQNLQMLDFECNEEFPVITESLLSNCNSLRNLSLINVQIEPSALRHLVNLKTLTLTKQSNFNVIKENLASFEKLEKLKFLDCGTDGGDFSHLTRKTLSGLNNVYHIEFSNSNIYSIDADAFTDFKKLEYLHLGNNKLTRCNFGHGLINLRVLHLGGNSITEFNSDDMTHLPNLDTLDLGNNKLTTIDNIRHSVLRTLRVGSNRISQINIESLKANLPNLEMLNIQGNLMSPEYMSDLERKWEGVEFEDYLYEYD